MWTTAIEDFTAAHKFNALEAAELMFELMSVPVRFVVKSGSGPSFPPQTLVFLSLKFHQCSTLIN
jgi:hypothetical protein